MTELWTLHGPHWKLPLTVEWHGEIARIRSGGPGVRLMNSQIKAAHELLVSVGAEQRLNTFWAVRNVLSSVASQSSETDPEAIVSWVPVPPAMPESNEFIEGFCRDTGLVKLNLMNIIWTALCQYALRWLLAGRSLSLGFATIHALPYRKNWIEVLRQKPAKVQEDYWRGSLTGIEFTKRDRRGGKYNDRPYVVWTLHVTESKRWEQAVREHELKSKTKGERFGLYLLRVKERLKNNHEVARDLYVEFARQASLARVQFPSFPLVGCHKAWRRITRKQAVLADDERSDRALAGIHKPKKPEPDAASGAGLSAVPALQPYPPDLWDSAELLPECGGRTGD